MKSASGRATSAPLLDSIAHSADFLHFAHHGKQYSIAMECLPNRLAGLASLKSLGDRRNTAALGLFVVVFASLALTVMALGEGVRSALVIQQPDHLSTDHRISLVLPAILPMVNFVMGTAWVALVALPVVLAGLLGISLGQAIRAPRPPQLPRIDQDRTWLISHNDQIVGHLKLQPEQLGLRLVWLGLKPTFRGQGLGQNFVRRVLQAEATQYHYHLAKRETAQQEVTQSGKPQHHSSMFCCRVKLPPKSQKLKLFWSRCGFVCLEKEEAKHSGSSRPWKPWVWSHNRGAQKWMLYRISLPAEETGA